MAQRPDEAAKLKGGARRAPRKPTAVDQSIGQLIRQRRLELGLNLADLAGRLGIAVQQLHKYETAENRVSASRLVDLARELEVPVAWFFERSQATSQVNKVPTPSEEAKGGASHMIELLTLFDSLAPAEQRKLIEIGRLLTGSR